MPAEDQLLMQPATFAFTDIEGSTARWERDRVAMQEAVRRHDAILREAIAERGGSVFKTGGDAFYCAFSRPEDAVAAMLSAQQKLAAEDFCAVEGLRVRAAIHSGTAEEREGDYFGPAVNKVARLLAIGHGGQVLLTAETARLVDGVLPNDVSLRDLGTYHLKDFSEPQRVHQLVAPGLPAEFPPLLTLGTLPSDLSIVDAAQFHPVSSFSGRDDELAAVHAALSRDGAIAVVHGLGGVGKSSVAREYGWRNRDTYSVIWWLNAQTEDRIIDGFVSLGAMFVQGVDRLDDRRAAAKRVVNSVLGGFDKPVLLVFDNLEDEALLRSWLPRSARALATSRDTAWSADITPIPLQTWSLETAIGYLRRASGRTDLSEANARAIAQPLGALPLALAHAAASLRNARMVSPQRYLEQITERLKSAPRGAEYPHSVFATFSTAIAQAEQHASGAAAVLCFAASFAADAIPDELFRQPVGTYADGLTPALADGIALELHSVIADGLRLDEALGALDRLSLLSFTASSRTYSMHRLVQLAAYGLAGETVSWRECAVEVTDAAFPEVELATWPQCERLLSHALTALDALSSNAKLVCAGSLANRCSVYLRARAEYGPAESLSKRALSIWENAVGPEHPEVANSLNRLALVYWNQGRYAEAEPLYMRARVIQEKVLGPDHPEVANSLNGLALVYWNQGRYAEAEPLFTRAIAIWENEFGPDHPRVAHSLNNLAIIYLDQGRHAAAEPLQRRALAIREKALGPNHPDVAASLNNLAVAYHDQGRYAEAEPLHARALAIKQKALGPDHPDVARSLNDLANIYWEQGRCAEAESLQRRALAIREKALGPEHPDVAQSLNDLANVFRAQERYAEAQRLYTRALAIREKALGPDHPEVAESLYGLATVCRDYHRSQEAEPLLSRSLSIRENALGSDHPFTRATREALDALRMRS